MIQQHSQTRSASAPMASHRSGEMQLETYGFRRTGGDGGMSTGYVDVRPTRQPLDHWETQLITDISHGLNETYDSTVVTERLHDPPPLTDASTASASAQSPAEPPLRTTPDGTARIRTTARHPDQQRGDSRPTTTTIVNCTELGGQIYLFVFLGKTVIMIHIG